MDLITVAEYKTRFGISDTTQDEKLGQLVSYVSTYVANYCNRDFEKKAVTERVSGGGEYIVVTEAPINSITSIKESNIAIDSTYYTFTSEGYLVFAEDSNKNMRCFADGYRNIEISYNAGYTDSTEIPGDLKEACFQLISIANNQENKISSKAIGDYSVTFRSLTEQNNQIKLILNNYKSVLDLTSI